MRKVFLLSLAFVSLMVANSFASEIYESTEFKFKVKFPAEFEASTETEDDYTYHSVTSSYGSMIFMINCLSYNDEVPEDEYLTYSTEGLVALLYAFEGKVKAKKLDVWEVDGTYGVNHPLKGKLNSGGTKTKLFGMIYTIMLNNIEYRFTIVSTSKKDYDEAQTLKFINSFEII